MPFVGGTRVPSTTRVQSPQTLVFSTAVTRTVLVARTVREVVWAICVVPRNCLGDRTTLFMLMIVGGNVSTVKERVLACVEQGLVVVMCLQSVFASVCALRGACVLKMINLLQLGIFYVGPCFCGGAAPETVMTFGIQKDRNVQTHSKYTMMDMQDRQCCEEGHHIIMHSGQGWCFPVHFCVVTCTPGHCPTANPFGNPWLPPVVRLHYSSRSVAAKPTPSQRTHAKFTTPPLLTCAWACQTQCKTCRAHPPALPHSWSGWTAATPASCQHVPG